MNNEIYEDSDLDKEDSNATAGTVVWFGAVIAVLIIGICLLFSTAEAQAPVKLQVEPFIPADTCALVYDMRGFKGKTLDEYFDRLESLIHHSGETLLFLRAGHLCTMYHVEFKPQKACLSDLLDQAVSGTDLTWKCEGRNILIWRR